MMEWLVWGSGILATELRVCLGMMLVAVLLSSKSTIDINKKRIVLIIVSAILLHILVRLINATDLYAMIPEAVFIAWYTNKFLQTDFRKSLFVSLFYSIAISLWMFLSSLALGVLFVSERFLDTTDIYGQAAVWLSHVVLLILMGYVIRHRDMERSTAFRLVTGVVLATFVMIVSLAEQTILPIDNDTFTMWMILSVILPVGVLVFNMSFQYEVEKELVRLKTEQTELLEREYTSLNQTYSANAKLFHDLHNHIGTLRQLLVTNNYNEAISYLDELQEPIKEITNTKWTGDKTVDYLINSKMAEAASCHIQFHAQVEFPRNSNVRGTDLCAILGNLLDNALDAVKKNTNEKEREIHLTIRRIHQMLVIKVENPFLVSPEYREGELQTTKKEPGLHGWGVKSAKTAAEKYDGTVRTTVEGNKFRAVATLSFYGVEQK